MERAIINIRGFFPVDIAYSRVLVEHLDAAVEAVPIAHHGSSRSKCYATESNLGYSRIPRLRRSSRMFVGKRSRFAEDLRSLGLRLIPHVIELVFLGVLKCCATRVGFHDQGTNRPQREITIHDALRLAVHGLQAR